MWCSAVIAGLLTASTAHAGVIAFESFYSDADPYSPGRPWHWPGSGGGSGHWGQAYRFVPVATGTVESMEVGAFVTLSSLADLPIRVSIHSDVGGWISDELGSGMMPARYISTPFPSAPVTVTPDDNINLVAGQAYWLSIQGDVATIPPQWVRWYLGDNAFEAWTYSAQISNVVGGPVWGINDAPGQPGAFRVLVPSPSAASILAAAGLVAASRRRRR